MQEFSEEEFQSVAETLRKSAPEGVRVLNTFVRTIGPYRPLLKADNAKSVAISKEAREFSLKEPCYLTRIDIIGGDVSLISSWLSLVAVKLDGSRTELKARSYTFTNADGTKTPATIFDVDCVVRAVEARSKRTYWALKAQHVRVIGYALSQLEEAAGRVASTQKAFASLDAFVEKRKSEVRAASERKDALEGEIEILQETASELRSDIEKLEANTVISKESNDAELLRQEGIDRAVLEANSRLELVNNNEVTLRETVNSLNRDIVKNKNELDKLLNDRNLISDEYKDYVAEGKQQSLVYQVFVLFLIGVIGLCAWQLYTGAQRILASDVSETKELLALILQRAPFAAALSFIVAVAWKLAAMFVSRIMTIHAQRLALARLLVIAKDTVYSSTAGLEVTDQQKFRERIRLKLVMLRAHLTSELGKDFEYLAAPEDPAKNDEPGESVKPA